MTSAGRSPRSKKPSAASRPRKRRKPFPAFYVDECIGRSVARGLTDAGYLAHAAVDHFQGQPDHVWLPEIGGRNWVLITKDQHIRRNPLEVQAILNAGVRAFVLTATDLSPADALALLVGRMTKIRRICQRKGPFIFNITATGIIAEVSPAQLRKAAKQQRTTAGLDEPERAVLRSALHDD